MTISYTSDVAAILSKPTASVDELARVLEIGRNQAYAAVRSGQIRSIRLGKRIRIPTAAIVQLLEGEPVTPLAQHDAPGLRAASF